MNLSDLFFYFFALFLVIASLGVVMARNPLYNVLSLVVAIFCLSSLFMILEAFFVGIILLMVYAGAILIFFLFVVMCLNLNAPTFTSAEQSRFRFLGWLVGLLFFAELLLASRSFLAAQTLNVPSVRGTIENVGRILFTDYLLPFELTSLLLLIAVFGIVALAQGALKTGKEESQP